MLKTVLIDIDNTLLDFDRCAEASIRQGLSELGIPCPAGMFPVFRRVNDTLWREIEKGNLTRPGLRAIRWPWIFDRFDIDADGEAFEDRFVQLLWESHESVDGAEDLLRHLSARYALYAASNAPAGEQEHRLRLAGFDRYFQGLFISQEMGGAPKPSREFFDACFQRLGNPPREEVLLIGDSLTADIQGAAAYGLPCCWFDHDGTGAPAPAGADHVARKLTDILQWY